MSLSAHNASMPPAGNSNRRAKRTVLAILPMEVQAQLRKKAHGLIDLKLERGICLFVCMYVQQKMNKIRLVLGG